MGEHTEVEEQQHHQEGCCELHAHIDQDKPWYQAQFKLLLALVILVVLLVLEYGFHVKTPQLLRLCFSLVAFLLAGIPVLTLAWHKIKNKDFFNEFVLMTVATIGAFAIGEYEEGVAVMVFYQIGEWFQDAAVDRAKSSIKSLLNIRPDRVTVIRNGSMEDVHPATVGVGETILVKSGEKVALDGILLSEKGSFDTAALTGESKPDMIYSGQNVWAGMINLTNVSQLEVVSQFKESKLSKILEMVQDAASRKSKTQLFISRFAKIYVPIVFALALMALLVPAFFVEHYEFKTWFYRALVFLVVSCPCALVVSIPLGYFGGIGLASKNGILFKGGNFLDAITTVDTIVMDKTGTLTEGVFEVNQVISDGITIDELLAYAKWIESRSTHPIAKAITVYRPEVAAAPFEPLIEEVSGHGLIGDIDGKYFLAGNTRLLKANQVEYPAELERIVDSIVLFAYDGEYIGHITVSDRIKMTAVHAVKEMKSHHLYTVMLSGDKSAVVNKAAQALRIDKAYGDLLPEDKVNKVQMLLNEGRKVAFAGDGVNDAPVVALATVGIAMGGLGADATIETADVVIQNDDPQKILTAIKIGKITRNVVWQNVILAMSVKIIVLILGAGGVANLWEAVIADVGVALVAILNAYRIQQKKI